MKIKELICRESYGNVKEISKYNQSLLKTMISQMSQPQNLIPAQFYREWIRGNNSVIEKMSLSLLKDYPVEVRCGYKPKRFFISSLFNFDICDYIRRCWSCKIDFRENILLTFDQNKYCNLTLLIMSIIINKYKIETLYHEHIIFICIKVMTTFFTLYKDDQFLVRLDYVHNMATLIFKTEISELETYSKNLGFHCQDRPEKKCQERLLKKKLCHSSSQMTPKLLSRKK